jgi:NAD(P)H-quinone oxidoreductase subunit 5
LLRAPTLLHDYHTLENAIGDHLRHRTSLERRLIPRRFEPQVYRLFLERGRFDSLLNEYLVRPFLAVFRWCDAIERRWTGLLGGTSSSESARLRPATRSEELP